jgi:hypothetical protein
MGTDELQIVIRRSIETRGVSRTADLLELSAEATCRIAGGLKTQRGTRAQAERNAHKLSDSEGPRSAA